MSGERRTTPEEARRVGDQIGVDWDRFELEQFRAGMDVEYEHGRHDPQTDVTGDDPVTTGKIALAHMKEFPDYYGRLERMEQEAERDWAARRQFSNTENGRKTLVFWSPPPTPPREMRSARRPTTSRPASRGASVRVT